MKYIDLHVHSVCSDGTFTPEQLVDMAIDKDLVTIAVTDHDTVAGVGRAIKAAEGKPLQVIPGVEISCEYDLAPGKPKEIHILGYQLDYQDPDLIATLQMAADERDNRNVKMCENLNKAGYPITYEDLVGKYPNTILTRAHFARFLLEKGVIPDIPSAFKKILAEDGPYFVRRKYLTPEEGIEAIKKAGGIPVLAHPLLYKLDETQLRSLIERLIKSGIRGLEAMYSRNKGNDEAFVRGLAREYGLFYTGGSDFHGSNKPDIELGRGVGNLRIPETILENLQ
ncbi:MAG: PHP domain-containing protein [Eubacterium sp.]|nr:PHP domain-containing protein [Eubacterium sp.]